MLATFAQVLARPSVADWLIQRAKLTPYSHIVGTDGIYMERYWLFNPYPSTRAEARWWKSMLPSIRIHRILRKDREAHLHDHPWNVRTFILRGWYVELRERESIPCGRFSHQRLLYITRRSGDTASLKFGEYHRIEEVSPEGVWTLFVTWKKRGTWGFNVDGKKIPWREYLSKENK